MREKWNKLIRDVKGAVTVFVTLLLIPAILVTGSGVDLARLYVAKSIVRDANQMAANSTLTEYDALLQDLYGLFGVCTTDPELGKMIDDYVKIAVFGEEPDTSAGAFKLFDGSDLNSSDAIEASNQNLDNVQVLRRQIEEYAKIRAPIIIAKEILDVIDQFQKIKQDADAIKTKMELDEKVDEIDKLYKELYEKIKEFNKFTDDVRDLFTDINNRLDRISGYFKDMNRLQGDYRNGSRTDNFDENKLEDMKLHYNGLVKNVRVVVSGGKLNAGWVDGDYNSNGNWESGHWGEPDELDVGLKDLRSAGNDLMNDYEKQYKAIRDLCVKIERKKGELSAKVDELESKLNSCSDGLVDGLSKKDPKTGLSVIDNYRLLLKNDTVAMADAMIEKDKPIIEDVRAALDPLFFGDQNQGATGGLTLSVLEHMNTDKVGFSIEALAQDVVSYDSPRDKLSTFSDESNYRYKTAYGFIKFQDVNSTNGDFYNLLQKMYEEGSANDKAKKQMKDVVKSFFKATQDKMKKGASFTVSDGANYYLSNADKDQQMQSVYGQEGNWDSENVGAEKTEDALGSDIVSKMGDLVKALADKALLVTYDTSMFSCWTTENGTKSMSGIPMDNNVNYFYHSEQEYLLTGSNVAAVNLAAVAGLLLLVRFVFNYIASFSIEDVCTVVDSIKAALTPIAPLNVLIAEAARAGIAMAESAVDVIRLRSGEDVAVLKIGKAAEDWRLSLQGLLDYVKEASEDAAKNLEKAINDNAQSAVDTGTEAGDLSEAYFTMDYTDYMRIFLAFEPGDTLAQRTGELIEFNLTNYNNKIKADESKMSKATLEDLAKLKTGFTITTTVNLRMLFLSLPFAQEGINGVVPPGKVAIRAVDYRGY